MTENGAAKPAAVGNTDVLGVDGTTEETRLHRHSSHSGGGVDYGTS